MPRARLSAVVLAATAGLTASFLVGVSPAMAATTAQSINRVVGGSTIGSLTTTVTDDGPLATASVPATRLSLPAGTYDMTVCLSTAPVSASSPQPCASATTTMRKAGTVNAPSTSLVVYRPLDTTPVTVQSRLDVRLRTGSSSTLFATSAPGDVIASAAVSALTTTAATAQLRGSNVHLFKDGVTLDDMAKDLDVLQQAGATMVRTAFPWPLLQPNNTPTFDQAAVDKVDGFLQLAAARRIKVLAILGSTPCWASSASTTVKAGCTQTTGDWARYPTHDTAALQRAAKEFGSRWGQQLAGVEYWNEPDSSQFFAGTAKDYVNLLKVFYPALKSTAPKLTVLTGGLALSDTTFLQALYASGARGYFDAVAAHPYELVLGSTPATSDPASAWPAAPVKSTFALGVRALHQVMAGSGDAAKPLWITEMGFSDCTVASAVCVSPEQQADYLASSFRMAARWSYVPVVLSYLTRDIAADGSWLGSYGMVGNDYTAKPALAAVTDTWSCLSRQAC